MFCGVSNKQLMELNICYPDTNVELLHSMGCLNSKNSLCAFNKEHFISFSRLHPTDFFAYNIVLLDNQFENYIIEIVNFKQKPNIFGMYINKKLLKNHLKGFFHLFSKTNTPCISF